MRSPYKLLSHKPRYKLVEATIHCFMFRDVNAPAMGGNVYYVLPRHRLAVMFEGRWPW